MRISDWSSDVCSSDLVQARHCGFGRNLYYGVTIGRIMSLTRRSFIGSAGLLATGGAIGFQLAMQAESKAPFEVNLSDAEWKKRLTPRQYAVLRNAATERPLSSPLNAEHRNGVFLCAGCRLPLFSSVTKIGIA